MTDQQAADQMTIMSWEAWSPQGIKLVAETLGPMGEYERRIFEAGWKLGYQCCLEQNQQLNILLRERN